MSEGNPQRLDKVLVHMGCGSRSEIKKLAKQKQIEVNGQVVTDTGMKVNPAQDQITVCGKFVHYREFIYMMLNKPQGVISATEDARDRTVLDLLEPWVQAFQPFPVGRLDKDTEGLLLLTNDGKLAHELLSPKKHVEKTYEVEAAGELTEQEIRQLEEGITLDDGYVTLPAKAHILSAAEGTTKLHLTITEGKFHQVKRMLRAVGSEVTFLKRISMGPLRLDDALPIGHYRELTDEEITALKERRQTSDL
ncbi:pseudouridine synthase [Marinicrinis lubricantis]|uniref:Pseudouridine synthase n=1 Tax=Marinicrinis lubricantis TaxID=2086470 RepID=A0ABW1IT75_9BACL